MNWYKKSHIKTASLNELIKRILKILGISSITTLAGIMGLSITQAVDKIQEDPQKVIQQVQQIQEDNTEQQTEDITEDTTRDAININIKDLIIKHEGKRNKVYYVDNIPHIGIGFNLQRADAEQLLNNAGVNIEDILSGQQSLNDNQINYLFQYTLEEARQIAYNFIPDLDEYPQPIQAVIIDMSFNLNNSIYKFKNFKEAILHKNYDKAIEEMKNSQWYSQVPNRVDNLISIINKVK
ncbi:MAG: hypothetical protein ACOCP8_03935 [archaeon]